MTAEPSAPVPASTPHLRVVHGQGRDTVTPGALLLGTAAVRDARGSAWSPALQAAQDQVRQAGHAEKLLEDLVGAASALVDAAATAALFSDGVLVRRAATAGAPRMLVGSTVELDGTVCGEAVSTRRVVRTGETCPVTASPACCPGARSHLVLPLLDHEDLLGVLTLTSAHHGWFDENDEGAVAMLAGVAARVLAGLPVQREISGRAARPADDDIDSTALHGLGMWNWDAATGVTSCSPSVAQVLGLEAEEHLTLGRLRELIHPEDLPRFETMLTDQLTDQLADLPGRLQPAVQHGAGGTFRIRSPHGERQVHAWGETRRAPSGTVIGAWGAAMDVTEREQQAAALRSSLAGLRAAKKLTGLGLWEWHPREGALTWSDEMYRFVGLEPGEIRPSLELWHRAIHPDDREKAMLLDALAGEADGGSMATFRVIGFDRVERHVQSWSTVIPADGVSPAVVAGAAVDVTRQVRDRAELDHRSATDPVTGLANRLGFERWISRLLSDPGREVGLLLADLDRFKMVNDSFGHQVGDQLLVEVARRLERVTPAGSLNARMGGDEFVIVPPPGMAQRDLRTIAQNILDALRVPFSLDAGVGALFCPASIGVTSTAGRTADAEVLLAEADLALYRAKDDGRDRFTVFDDAMRHKVRDRHRTEQLLRAAIEENRLVLAYQPIVDLTHGRVVGAEALIRMRSEDGSLLGPDSFIGVAEDIGLSVDLDCWVMQTALDQLARWLLHAPPSQVPWLAVNVSPRSMEHPRAVRTLLDGVRERGLPPNLLKVELTESSFLSSLPGGEKALQTLLANEIPVGIDDFGTGYSALAYLMKFELDFMKIDRSFVAKVGQDTKADDVVDAIVNLAHARRMKVTAEGIETAHQARRLREIGCDYAQGFHFGRPGDAARILRG